MNSISEHYGVSHETILFTVKQLDKEWYGAECPSVRGAGAKIGKESSLSTHNDQEEQPESPQRRKTSDVPLTEEQKHELDQKIRSGYFFQRNHEGKCRVCNTPLTSPESLALGIGPECLKHIGAGGV